MERAAGERDGARLDAEETTWHGGGGGTLGYCALAADVTNTAPASSANAGTQGRGIMLLPAS